MNFGERAAARRKSKELKNELKDMRKDFLGVGYDKTLVANLLKELQETAELADTLQSDYVEAGEHLRQAREAIMKLLDYMGESPAAEVQESLNTLISDLDQVYHDCSIREDAYEEVDGDRPRGAVRVRHAGGQMRAHHAGAPARL